MGDHVQCHPRAMSVDGSLNLPPGFRFYPKDGELITFYLTPKVQEKSFTCIAIGEVDLNKTEPWELPNKAKIGEKEWYFFSQKDRKYSTSSRTNRATKGGYWKATGKDKEIYRAITGKVLPVLVGMKKTLVFYKGRAPKGKKTNWIMHEYRLEGKDNLSCPTSSSTSTATVKSSSTSEEEWVVCRVFKKTTGIKKSPTPPSYNMSIASTGIDHSSIPMPLPLQFPMLPDFTMDPAGSYYSTTGMSSSLVPPMIPPMVGMGSNVLQMNRALFGNPMAIAPPMPFNPMANAPPMSSFNPMANAPPMSFNPMDIAPPMPFYHQVGIGTVGADGFMAAMESGPSLMVSQKDTGMSIDQTNSGIALESTSTMDLDRLLEILRSQVG